MDWKLHIIIPLILYGVIMTVFSFSLEFGVAALLILVFSTLLPDLDHPKSFIRYLIVSSLFFLVTWFVVICVQADFMTKVAAILIMFVLFFFGHKRLPVHHRGEKSLHLWRYSFLFSGVFLILLVLAGIDLLLGLFFLLGYSVHLLLDRVMKL